MRCGITRDEHVVGVVAAIEKQANKRLVAGEGPTSRRRPRSHPQSEQG
ncbi:MAG: hypothetical protein QNL01_05345 [Akkermansiaceae bacterium]